MFFFFKQKTAYEMRISDWSSDVCSSDLLAGASRQAARNKVLAVKQVLRMSVTLRKGLRKVFGKLLSVIGPWHPWPWKGRVQIGCGSVVIKIGRASCRERVCQ